MNKYKSDDPCVDNEEYFNNLLVKPEFSWLTFSLFVTIITSSIVASYLALNGLISIALAMTINTICSYIAYSIVHEAAHGLICSNKMLNNWVGRVSLFMVSITPFFRTYRFLHITHHRFTNDVENDPDFFCGSGSKWTLPFRWMVMDIAYIMAYLKPGNYDSRPKVEKIEFWLAIGFAVNLLLVITWMNWWEAFFLLYIIPTRISIFVLAIVFDYLPHYPHKYTSRVNKYVATNNRVGLEWLLTPLLLGQNYHLSHHLYPVAPFYRYRRIWKARQLFHHSKQAAEVKFYKLKAESDSDFSLNITKNI
ncbi:MAG: fatty acid desaturase [Methylococcaceae bacterium]